MSKMFGEYKNLFMVLLFAPYQLHVLKWKQSSLQDVGIFNKKKTIT